MAVMVKFLYYELCEIVEGYYIIIITRFTESKSCYIWQIKCMKAALVSALRREKMAETTIQNLKAEIDHRNCLVSMF